MAQGLGFRLRYLRNARGLSVKELATRTGLAASELLALENSPAREVTPETLKRLAEFYFSAPEYIGDGIEPAAAALRSGFFRYYDSLAPEERRALKMALIQGRIDFALRYLETAYPTLFDRSQVAARLGYSPEALADVVRGNGPLNSRLLKILAGLLGLDQAFFIRGDFFGGAMETDQDISPARLSEYYRVVQEAIGAGISPAVLRKAIQILTIRDQEE